MREQKPTSSAPQELPAQSPLPHGAQGDEKDTVCAVTPGICWLLKWLRLFCVLDVRLLALSKSCNSLRKSYINYAKLISVSEACWRLWEGTWFDQACAASRLEADVEPGVLLFLWPWSQTTESSMQGVEGIPARRGRSNIKPGRDSGPSVAAAGDQASYFWVWPQHQTPTFLQRIGTSGISHSSYCIPIYQAGYIC